MQTKQVLLVDGIVKSGKTIVARYIAPLIAVQHPFFDNALSIYIDMGPLADIDALDRTYSVCDILLTHVYREEGSFLYPVVLFNSTSGCRFSNRTRPSNPYCKICYFEQKGMNSFSISMANYRKENAYYNR
jgi:hypothetical protein